jgi:hypothetical protein
LHLRRRRKRLMERALNASLAVLGSLLAIFVGLMWSKGVLSRGTFGFDMGYLPVALGLSWWLGTLVRGKSLNLLSRVRLFAPLGSVFLFEVLADYSLSRLHVQMSPRWLFAFGLFSTLMLLTTLVLVARFNYAEAFGPFSAERRRHWHKWTLFAVLALGILVIWGPARILITLRTAEAFSVADSLREALIALESWFYRSSLMAYLFIVTSMLFPTLEDRLFGPPVPL